MTSSRRNRPVAAVVSSSRYFWNGERHAAAPHSLRLFPDHRTQEL
jgi:hypothetical protein